MCSLHFNTNDIVIRGNRKTVAKGGLPSIFQDYNVVVNRSIESDYNEIIDEPEFNLSAFNFERCNDEQQQFDLGNSCEQQAELYTDVR